MSFSSDIKTELCKVEFKRECCLRAECYGAWLFSRCFTRKEAAFVTENGAVARRLLELAAAGAGISGELTFGVSRRRKPAYRVSLPDGGSRLALLEEFGHTGQETSLRLNRANLENSCCAAAFLRGAFLTCGTATDPRKEYHLEFAVPYKNLANDLYTPFPLCGGAERGICGLLEGERPHRGPAHLPGGAGRRYGADAGENV